MRGYYSGWDSTRSPEGTQFSFNADHRAARRWNTRMEAENECVVLEGKQIILNGVGHVCRGFQVEELAPGEFVIYCEAPFLPPLKERVYRLLERKTCNMPGDLAELCDAPLSDIYAVLHELRAEGRVVATELFGRGVDKLP